MPSSRSLPLLLGLITLLSATPGLAQTYKWVDENGIVNYTQTPPPTKKYDNVRTTKPAVDPDDAKRQLQDRVDAFQKRRDDAAKSKSEASKKQAAADKKRADCEQAKKNLTVFETKTRIKFTDKDGNVKVLPENERQAKLAQIRENVKKLCK